MIEWAKNKDYVEIIHVGFPNVFMDTMNAFIFYIMRHTFYAAIYRSNIGAKLSSDERKFTRIRAYINNPLIHHIDIVVQHRPEILVAEVSLGLYRTEVQE